MISDKNLSQRHHIKCYWMCMGNDTVPNLHVPTLQLAIIIHFKCKKWYRHSVIVFQCSDNNYRFHCYELQVNQPSRTLSRISLSHLSDSTLFSIFPTQECIVILEFNWGNL